MNGILGIPGFQSGYMQAYGPSNYSLPYTSAVGQTPYTMGNSMGGGGILDFSSYLQPFQAQRQQWQDDPSQTWQPMQPEEPQAPSQGAGGGWITNDPYTWSNNPIGNPIVHGYLTVPAGTSQNRIMDEWRLQRS